MGWKILTLDDTISYKHWKLSRVQGGTDRKKFLRAAHLEGSPKKHLGGEKKKNCFPFTILSPIKCTELFPALKDIQHVYLYSKFNAKWIPHPHNSFSVYPWSMFPEVDTVYFLSKGEKRISRILFMTFFSLVPTSQSQAQNHTDGGSEPGPGLSHLGWQCLRYTMLLRC